MIKDEIEQHIVINDLLSFISCKMKNCNKHLLLKSIKKFYPMVEISDAHKVLHDILPDEESTQEARNHLNARNRILGLYECLLSLPQEESPLFVCRNLNNIPAFDEVQSSRDESSHFKRQQKQMEQQLSSVSDLISGLQHQIAELDRLHIGNPSNHFVGIGKSKLSIKQEPSESEGFGLARLQKLIDEDADKNPTSNTGDNQVEVDEVSDWEDDMDFENVAPKENAQWNYEVLEQNPDADDSDASKIIVVASDLDVRDATVDFLDDPDDQKIFRAEKSMIVSSEISPTKIRPAKRKRSERTGSDTELDLNQDLRRPYIIVENGFDENIGNFLVFRCSLCNFASNDENALPQHTCSVVPHPVQVEPQQYTCQFCPFVAEHARSLNEHLIIHRKPREQKPLQCVLCYFECSDGEEYKNHLRGHQWKRPYTCDYCDFRSNDQAKLRKHSYWHLEYKGPEHYECHICDKVCGSVNALEKHKQMHSRNLPFECNYCGISFHHEGKLYTHVLTHTVEKSYACKYCDHATETLHFLIHHETGHLRDKKAECHICGEIFSNRATLRLHVTNEHKDLKSFKCDVCSEPFATESDARMHRRKAHDSIVKLVCPYCMRTYKDDEYYKRHLEMHQQEAA